MYTVPFWIWTNYDTEEKTDVHTSLNYLSNLVLDTAGVEKGIYGDFLEDIQQVIPRMNASMYYSRAEQKMIALEEAQGDEADMLQRYHVAAYNGMFASEKTKLKMFQ